MGNHRFENSAGLVAITKDGKVVMIRRRVPYCYENYLLRKRLRLTTENFARHEGEFICRILPKLPTHDVIDFVSYYCETGTPMEDEYDFPHGQLPRNVSRAFSRTRLQRHLVDLYRTALREFREETGLMIEGGERDYDRFCSVSFVANDGNEYHQFYFVVCGVTLIQAPLHQEQQYVTVLLDVKDAVRVLLEQQRIKKDGKYRLITESTPPIFD